MSEMQRKSLHESLTNWIHEMVKRKVSRRSPVNPSGCVENGVITARDQGVEKAECSILGVGEGEDYLLCSSLTAIWLATLTGGRVLVNGFGCISSIGMNFPDVHN